MHKENRENTVHLFLTHYMLPNYLSQLTSLIMYTKHTQITFNEWHTHPFFVLGWAWVRGVLRDWPCRSAVWGCCDAQAVWKTTGPGRAHVPVRREEGEEILYQVMRGHMNGDKVKDKRYRYRDSPSPFILSVLRKVRNKGRSLLEMS